MERHVSALPEEVLGWRTLTAQLPVVFPNGSKLEHVTITCADCATEVSPDETRAEMALFPASVATFRTFAECPGCGSLIRTDFRVRETDGGWQMEQSTHNGPRVWRARATLWARLRGWMRRPR